MKLIKQNVKIFYRASMYKGSPQKGKSIPQKGGPGRGEGPPPDLWIDHDHLELKQMGRDERAESSISVASTRRNSLSSVHTNNQGMKNKILLVSQIRKLPQK
jgi:hypothetical protein